MLSLIQEQPTAPVQIDEHLAAARERLPKLRGSLRFAGGAPAPAH